MLDVKKLLARMLKYDYVIEDGFHRGTNGEIRYKKWAHGTLEISVYLYGFNLLIMLEHTAVGTHITIR